MKVKKLRHLRNCWRNIRHLAWYCESDSHLMAVLITRFALALGDYETTLAKIHA